MIDLGEHWVFVVGAYAVATLAVAALIVWVAADARRQRARLAELEAKGIRRRSDGPGS
jgi:heme exporter protein D